MNKKIKCLLILLFFVVVTVNYPIFLRAGEIEAYTFGDVESGSLRVESVKYRLIINEHEKVSFNISSKYALEIKVLNSQGDTLSHLKHGDYYNAAKDIYQYKFNKSFNNGTYYVDIYSGIDSENEYKFKATKNKLSSGIEYGLLNAETKASQDIYKFKISKTKKVKIKLTCTHNCPVSLYKQNGNLIKKYSEAKYNVISKKYVISVKAKLKKGKYYISVDCPFGADCKYILKYK